MSKHLKHSNEIRIIGGCCRGRKIRFSGAEGLRPTPDIVRERLFNWLGQDLTGLAVLDLFAGSGALGLEAASRNAEKVVMVDNNPISASVLKKNAETLGTGSLVEVLNQDAFQYLRRVDRKFDVVFLDPPFAWGEWPALFGMLEKCLSEKAKVYMEAGNLPAMPQWLSEFRGGKAGKSRFEVRIYG